MKDRVYPQLTQTQDIVDTPQTFIYRPYATGHHKWALGQQQDIPILPQTILDKQQDTMNTLSAILDIPQGIIDVP